MSDPEYSKPVPPSGAKSACVHAIRLALVIGLLMGIKSSQPPPIGDEQPPLLESIQDLFPAVASVDVQASDSGLWQVRDQSGETIGSVARTLPVAESVVGYRGPSESLIVFDGDLQVIAVALIGSSDTTEHVDAVLADPDFFRQFRSWSWGGPAEGEKVDAVSGATLTSLAIAGGVLKRIGGSRPSLVFPDPVDLSEVTNWFPNAHSIRISESDPSINWVLDSDGATIGKVLRTGPLLDSHDGYQGPSELLLKLDGPTAESIQLRRSYDNEPYVGYVREEYGFWPMFEKRSVTDLAQMDLEAEEVEGVSGATMTSMAVAETLVAAAKKHLERLEKPDEPKRSRWQSVMTDIRISIADVATLIILVAAVWFRQRGWFRSRTLRRVWLIAVVIVIGFWAGNLLSLALVAGWSAEGIAWRLAPGLALLAVVAFLSPPLKKSNPYCNHLCPHGALQQLIKPSIKSKRKRALPRRLGKALSCLPGMLLVAGYVGLVMYPKLDLSSWEPFHAYLFRIAPLAAFALAIITLVVAAFIPMAYCRYGCPTGRLLDYVRRKANSDRFQLADAVALGLLVFAWIW